LIVFNNVITTTTYQHSQTIQNPLHITRICRQW